MALKKAGIVVRLIRSQFRLDRLHPPKAWSPLTFRVFNGDRRIKHPFRDIPTGSESMNASVSSFGTIFHFCDHFDCRNPPSGICFHKSGCLCHQNSENGLNEYQQEEDWNKEAEWRQSILHRRKSDRRTKFFWLLVPNQQFEKYDNAYMQPEELQSHGFSTCFSKSFHLMSLRI